MSPPPPPSFPPSPEFVHEKFLNWGKFDLQFERRHVSKRFEKKKSTSHNFVSRLEVGDSKFLQILIWKIKRDTSANFLTSKVTLWKLNFSKKLFQLDTKLLPNQIIKNIYILNMIKCHFCNFYFDLRKLKKNSFLRCDFDDCHFDFEVREQYLDIVL